MLRATLMLMLSVSWPLLALAADPAPAQADFEPKPLRSAEIHPTSQPTPLRGPEDFALPASELAPDTGKGTGSQERLPSPQAPSPAPVLEGF